jgi:hypothetical protein
MYDNEKFHKLNFFLNASLLFFYCYADYLKHLPEDSPDRPDTLIALDLVTKAASHSNEAMKKIVSLSVNSSLHNCHCN